MLQAIPYSCGRTSTPLPPAAARGGDVKGAVEGNAVVVVGREGCCMCDVVRRLLLWQGVNPVVCVLGEEMDATAELPAAAELPAVFIGGKHIGGLDRLMAVHMSGELVPLLKAAGALWL